MFDAGGTGCITFSDITKKKDRRTGTYRCDGLRGYGQPASCCADYGPNLIFFVVTSAPMGNPS